MRGSSVVVTDTDSESHGQANDVRSSGAALGHPLEPGRPRTHAPVIPLVGPQPQGLPYRPDRTDCFALRSLSPAPLRIPATHHAV